MEATEPTPSPPSPELPEPPEGVTVWSERVGYHDVDNCPCFGCSLARGLA